MRALPRIEAAGGLRLAAQRPRTARQLLPTLPAAYKQEHYRAHRQRYIDQVGRRKKALVAERLEYLLDYLREHPCVDCGESDPIVLEFDHLREKRFCIGQGFWERNWQSVLDEIAKCEVVCANCHRRRTARRGGFARAAVAQW
jgi:hypothetical protein